MAAAAGLALTLTLLFMAAPALIHAQAVCPISSSTPLDFSGAATPCVYPADQTATSVWCTPCLCALAVPVGRALIATGRYCNDTEVPLDVRVVNEISSCATSLIPGAITSGNIKASIAPLLFKCQVGSLVASCPEASQSQLVQLNTQACSPSPPPSPPSPPQPP
eukprot:CAMPEP_0119102300 /NCGR_PEP_ID=MMETSP1180-20130426/1085_1 /TAXON_ID=3052 ORGANISM="Chlamydomonas cf sp, Strain CCMP681" /NCGR_SAMPLE_ID=MMETSP1180 /ASSEMBLY_ACC=CAM_ASM_000741 /LENGTH=163 /DNA_ID=CAMNT_0007086555 /DNA_START=91 /DNA_END=579 /DNA_ORIENTATION=+